ncbi:MAG: hypothetical protein SNJ82_08645 [Gemmataceae bacterium]
MVANTWLRVFACLVTFSGFFVMALPSIQADEEEDKKKKEMISRLIAQAKSEIVKDRIWAARALAKMGPDAKPALRVLCRMFFHSNIDIQTEARLAIEAISPKFYESASILANSEDLEKVLEAMNNLLALEKEDRGPIGAILVSRMNHLLELRKANDWAESKITDQIIKKINKNEAAERASAVVYGNNEYLRFVKAYNIAILKNDFEMLTSIKEAKQGLDMITLTLVKFIGKLGGDDPTAVKILQEMMLDTKGIPVLYRTAAVLALGEIVETLPARRTAALAGLKVALGSRDVPVRQAAIVEALRLKTKAKTLETGLRTLSGSDPDPENRELAKKAYVAVRTGK